MEPKKPRKKRKEEDIIRDRIIAMLRTKGWFAKSTHGNMFQAGFPDIYATHVRYGHRWIEVKQPGRRGDVFTPAQHEVFPQLCANGDGVWVLEGADEENYSRLFRRRNRMGGFGNTPNPREG